MFSKLLDLIGMGDPPDVKQAKARMASDFAADPRRRSVWGILALSYDADPGYLTEHATTAVREWYGLGTPQALDGRIREYLAGGIGTPGYDVFRAAFLARAGFGANLLPEVQSWEASYQAVRVMQRHYQTWQHYGMGYLEGHVAYRAEQGDPPPRLAEIRQNLLGTMGKLMSGGGAWTAPFAVPMG